MNSLTPVERRYFERLFGMQTGYVLDFTDASFGEFFNTKDIDIHGKQFQTYGTSKAKKMRSFWDQATDSSIGLILEELLDIYEANCLLNSNEPDTALLEKSRGIARRLLGKQDKSSEGDTLEDFLHIEFALPDIHRLPVEPQAIPIIESRLTEIRILISAGAFLSTILMCGSVLEAVLLGAAQADPATFNRADASPKNKEGKVKPFHEWSLAQLIDVASESGLLKPDVKKFSHGLRDFRNYIHPYEQMASRFSPDQYTAKVCLHVLKAALASIGGERK
jgi:hypothetical protein